MRSSTGRIPFPYRPSVIRDLNAAKGGKPVLPAHDLQHLGQRGDHRPDVIEHQRAHAVRDPLGRAHNRTAHLAERRRMMTVWADYLDKLRAKVKVIPFKQAEGA